MLAEFGILDRFDFIGAADDGRHRHQKDDVIEYTLRTLGLPADADGAARADGVVMIGDRIHDLEGAKKFGVPCILVGWGYGPDSERGLADAVCHSPDELDRTARELLGL